MLSYDPSLSDQGEVHVDEVQEVGHVARRSARVLGQDVALSGPVDDWSPGETVTVSLMATVSNVHDDGTVVLRPLGVHG